MENKNRQQKENAHKSIAMTKKKGITMEDAVKIMEERGAIEKQ